MKHKGSLLGDLFDLDVLFGMLIGIAVPFLMMVAVQVNAIKEYQDLIAGILALFGAAIAVIAVMHQIRHAQGMEDDRRDRQMYAARSMMPHALASICEYAELCGSELRAVITNGHPPKDPEQVTLPDRFNLPRVSELPLQPVEQLLQTGDSEIQDRLAEIMEHLQVQQSRINSRSGHIVNNTIFARWYYTLIVDTLELHARASMLFNYARRKTDQIPAPLTREAFYSAAQQCGFGRPQWGELNKIIDERWQSAHMG